MKRTILEIGCVGLMIVVALNLIACSPVREVRAVEQQVVAVADAASTGAVATPVMTDTLGPSCANPTAEIIASCAAQAERILASTVRIEFHGLAGGIGHATVVGGRYLITHNHYPVTAAALQNGGEDQVTAISVFKANGDIILLKAPLSYFSVVAEESEMLVLDFQVYSGVGFFDSLSVPSADFRGDVDQLPQPGSEVAQIDWDGTTAHVDWVRVTAIVTHEGTPHIILENFVQHGASGGGVFFNGVHVGNNWTRQTDRLESSEIIRQYSLAALNAPDGQAIVNY